jgi:glyoxylase-like metal-dependent hydrolase (beta-lactamase superfamily II)
MEFLRFPSFDFFRSSPHRIFAKEVIMSLSSKRLVIAALSLTLASAFGFTSGQALAAAPMVKSQAPGYYRIMLGNFEVTALNDGTVDLPVDKLLHGRASEISKSLDYAYEKSPLETSVNAYLVNTGSRLVLIDSGAGAFFGPTLGKLVANLKAAGYQPAQVDDILITHLHPDHVGGIMDNGAMVFPNATIHVDSVDEDFWLSKAKTEAAPANDKAFFADAQTALAPYIAAGKVQGFNRKSEIVPGIKSIPTPGHTPGHARYLVESNGKKLLVVGDLLHVSAVQLKDPAITIGFDTDEKAAYASRMKILKKVDSKPVIVAAAHLSFPGLGHLRKVGKEWVWIPLNYTTEFAK